MNDSAGAGLLIILAAIYLLPTLIALARQHHNKLAIAALNTLLGWTVVGWVVSLIWSLTAIIKKSKGIGGSMDSAARALNRANAAVDQYRDARRRRAGNLQALRAELRSRGWDDIPDDKSGRIVIFNPDDHTTQIVISAAQLSVALRRRGQTVFSQSYPTPLDAIDAVYDLFERVERRADA
jgi:Superinfection immunity protein